MDFAKESLDFWTSKETFAVYFGGREGVAVQNICPRAPNSHDTPMIEYACIMGYNVYRYVCVIRLANPLKLHTGIRRKPTL